MTLRGSLREKPSDRLRQQEEMGMQSPNAAGSSSAQYRADHVYPAQPNVIDMKSIEEATPTWHSSHTCPDTSLVEINQHVERGIRSYSPGGLALIAKYPPPPTSRHSRNIPDELADLLMTMMPGREGEELAEAFRDASDSPPITKQSLGELDIQSVMTNIKLRHDVNFDRDLSFRPNLDGAKGQEKSRVANNYWLALVAELILYERLYRGAPPPRFEQTKWEAITHHAERRIPTMFQTIANVLKSLVPDRDHSRVDEHLDVAMLMQEIERGVCDLVRFAEWMAQLLKEHCAPMRDEWVDDMVRFTREGVTENDPSKIVRGLKQLLGILEAMKLDVANHQIRNLKTLLIEDTINFENHYQLDRLVNHRSRVNINTAHSWYADATEDFEQHCAPRQKDRSHLQLEVFVRVVVAVLFGRHGRSDFPETFYLDQDRLRTLKAEIDDLILFEVCMDMFAILAKDFGFDGPISVASGHHLGTSILAIMGDAMGHGPQQWSMNSEAISLEILRQASQLAGVSRTSYIHRSAKVNQHLRSLFVTSSASHAARLEAAILPQILSSVERHTNSSPMELFNSLVSFSALSPTPPTHAFQPLISDTFTFAHLHPETTKSTDLANRITHIISLHWRIWAPIAYVQEGDNPTTSSTSTDEKSSGSATTSPAMQPQSQPTTSANPELEIQPVASMRTGKSREPGQETPVSHLKHSQ